MAKKTYSDEPEADTSAGPADHLKSEQEKGGKDPVSDEQPMGSTKATKPDVHPKEPYPTGSPAVPPTAGVPMNEAPKES